MEPLTLIIFGITSSLAQTKLIPALYDMEEKGLMPGSVSIVGCARQPRSRKEFEEYVLKVLHGSKRSSYVVKSRVASTLIARTNYLSGNLEDPEFYLTLKKLLDNKTKKGKGGGNRIFYLATLPQLYVSVLENLRKSDLGNQDQGFVRLMVEKPIGHDLQSARQLNLLLSTCFKENQIYRIDHYLGKETLQNILAFRFGNDIFEPLINKDYVDHIQVTLAEDFGVETRGSYFDSVGLLKDVGQNHLLQMLAFATIDAPSEFANEAITRQRVKILRQLVPLKSKVVLGQYAGYDRQPNVSRGSRQDTYFAFKTFIANERFENVPIYLRSGKKLKETASEIAIVFKSKPNRIFKGSDYGDEPNVLIYRIQPNEGIVLKVVVKATGHRIKLQPEYMQYCYRVGGTGSVLPNPYERLISDTIRGDQTFFNDADEVEAQWAFIDQLAKGRGRPVTYRPGSWGPDEADKLIQTDGRRWLEPSMDFCRF